MGNLAQALQGFGLGAASQGALIPQIQQSTDRNRQLSLLEQINAVGGIGSQQGSTLSQQLTPQKQQQLQQGFEFQQSQDKQSAIAEQRNIIESPESTLIEKENAHLALSRIAPEVDTQLAKQFNLTSNRRKGFARDALQSIKTFMLDVDIERRNEEIDTQISKLKGVPGMAATVKGLKELKGLTNEEALPLVDRSITATFDEKTQADLFKKQQGFGDISVKQKEFESLVETAGLDDKQKQEAALIELGMSPRAVGSAVQTIAKEDLTELIADSQSVIRERTKFAEKTGASRANAIDKGFEKIAKIDLGLRNIDEAIVAIRAGAGVGAIESQFPSIKAASVELDFIQKKMALDVIGAVTFGALSKGELDLAREVALPTGLNTDELIDHLQRRKAAQTKLRAYFMEQIQFLDQGGTVAGFLRQKESGLPGEQQGGLSAEEQAELDQLRQRKAGQ